MELRNIVRLFEKIGAKCRKFRGREVYECWKGNVVARIDGSGIIIESSGEFRLEYSDFRTYDGYGKEDVLVKLRDVMGAESVDIDIPCGNLVLKLRFGLGNVDKALHTFNRMAEEDLWVVITNIKGELRLMKREIMVGIKEWLEVFK